MSTRTQGSARGATAYRKFRQGRFAAFGASWRAQLVAVGKQRIGAYAWARLSGAANRNSLVTQTLRKLYAYSKAVLGTAGLSHLIKSYPVWRR